ncbi:hypothetical protein [Marinobacter halodurans]|nr:hypothetical protein [Marinobacter halodurans]
MAHPTYPCLMAIVLATTLTERLGWHYRNDAVSGGHCVTFRLGAASTD